MNRLLQLSLTALAVLSLCNPLLAIEIPLVNGDFTDDLWEVEEVFIQNTGSGVASPELTGWLSDGLLRGYNLNIDGDDDPTVAIPDVQNRVWAAWQPEDGFRQIGFQQFQDPENAISQDAGTFTAGETYKLSVETGAGFEGADQSAFLQIFRASDSSLLAEKLFNIVHASDSPSGTESLFYTATGADAGSAIRIRIGTSGGSGTAVINKVTLIEDPDIPLALYELPTSGTDMTDRMSSDVEPLTLAADITGGVDQTGTDGGILIDGDAFNSMDSDAAFLDGDYLQFGIGLGTATSMSIAELNFDISLLAAESVFQYALRSSLDGYTTDIEVGDFEGVTPGDVSQMIDLSGVAGLQSVASDVTFRLALFDAFPDAGNGNAATVTSIELLGKAEGATAGGIEGDFNDDGIVNIADYTLWRDNLGAADESAINDNGDGGGITASDYQFWKDRFGNISGSGSIVASSTSGAIPEPASVVLTLLAAGSIGLVCRRTVVD